MKKYLITGGAGFIGSNFIHYMLDKYKDIFIVNLDKLTYAGNLLNLQDIKNNKNYKFIKGDICDSKLTDRLFAQYDFDYVVNFAAESHVDRSIENANIFFETNVMGTLNLIQTSMKYWKNSDDSFKSNRKYLQISTDEVYGSLDLDSKTKFSENTKINPHSPYSSSKASADLLVKSFYDTYKMPINITRCSNNYGPYQFPEKLIPLMFSKCMKEEQLPVYGDGKNVRDWIYVLDHCKAIDLVLHKGKVGEIYNVGGDSEVPNIDLVKKIIHYLSSYNKNINEKLITYVKDRKGHDRRYAIDFSKIKDNLGFCPTHNFDTSLKMTLDWYLNNKDWLEKIESGEYQNAYKA